MTIVQLDTHLPWRGGEQQVCYLQAFLHARGHHSVVVCQPQSALYRRAHEAGLAVRGLRMRHELDVLAVWRLGRLLRQHRVEILHMHTPRAHTLGLLASRLAPQVRKVVSRRVDFDPIRHRMSRWKYLRRDVAYLAVSEAVRRVLITAGVPASQVQTVHSGIDLRRLDAVRPTAPLFPEGSRVIGSVGHLAGHKGHRYLLEALPWVVQQEPRVRLAIVGSGDLRGDLESRAAALGIVDRVRFTGFRSDVWSLMLGFEVFVFPSVLEGLGTSVLDAMALRKPVVATRTGGIPEMVDDGVSGLLVPPRDPVALGQAIAEMLRHPERARVFGEAGRKRVEHTFTAEHMAARTLGVYQRLWHGTPT